MAIGRYTAVKRRKYIPTCEDAEIIRASRLKGGGGGHLPEIRCLLERAKDREGAIDRTLGR